MNPNALAFYTGAIQGVEQGRQAQYNRALQNAQFQMQSQLGQSEAAKNSAYASYLNSRNPTSLAVQQLKGNAQILSSTDRDYLETLASQPAKFAQAAMQLAPKYGYSGADALQFASSLQQGLVQAPAPNPMVMMMNGDMPIEGNGGGAPGLGFQPPASTPNPAAPAPDMSFMNQAPNQGGGTIGIAQQNADTRTSVANQGTIPLDTARAGEASAQGNYVGAQTQQLPGVDRALNFSRTALGNRANDQGDLYKVQGALAPGQAQSLNFYRTAVGQADLMHGEAGLQTAATGAKREQDYQQLVQSEIGLNASRAKTLIAKDPAFANNMSLATIGTKTYDDLVIQQAQNARSGTDDPNVDTALAAYNDPKGWYQKALSALKVRAQSDQPVDTTATGQPQPQQLQQQRPTLQPLKGGSGLMIDNSTGIVYKDGVPVRMIK